MERISRPRVRRSELRGLNVAAWEMVEQQNLPDRQRAKRWWQPKRS